MRLSVTFAELDKLRQHMGADLSNWKTSAAELDPRELLHIQLEAGISIEPSEVESGPGGLLSYRGEQVVLYIKDTRASLWTLQHEPEKTRRFHIAECKTLDKMREQGRFERYVVTNRTDGAFTVDWLDKDTGRRGESEAELKVCKNCLERLNYRGFACTKSISRLRLPDGCMQDDEGIWSSFSIAEFLQEYSTFFHSRPSQSDQTAVPNVYVANWSSISEEKRRSAGWVCENCAVNLSTRPGSLHCHHKNGVVTDNSSWNLQVLCALCHSKQPYHGHMKVPAQERAAILSLRGL